MIINFLIDLILLFYNVGILCSTLTCNNCKNKSHKDERFVDLSLSIQQMQQKRNSGDVLYTDSNYSLLKCLEDFNTVESLSDPIMCTTCSMKCVSEKQLAIKTPPIVLIIQLKRFNALLQKKVLFMHMFLSLLFIIHYL